MCVSHVCLGAGVWVTVRLIFCMFQSMYGWLLLVSVFVCLNVYSACVCKCAATVCECVTVRIYVYDVLWGSVGVSVWLCGCKRVCSI